MTRRCIDAVHAATGKVFSEAEIDDLLNRLADRARRTKAAAATLDDATAIRQASAELTREQAMGALIEQRLKVASEIARTERRLRLDAMPGDEAARLRAYDVGSEKQGPYTGASVDAEGRARAMSLWGQVELGLRQHAGLKDRLSNFWGFAQKNFDRLVAREMARLNGAGHIEPTGDEAALAAARIFNSALDRARVMQNEHGAWVARMEGYVARQTHDPLKIAGGFWRELGEATRRVKAKDASGALDFGANRQTAAMRAFGAWRDVIKPLLHERTFEGLDARDVEMGDISGKFGDPLGPDADLRDKFLYRVWYDIVTGRHEQLSGMNDLGEFRPPASKARSVSASRVLHFTSPDAWMDYNAKYGRGSLFATVMSQLERGGKNAALMARWGPAPEAARAAEIERLASEARARGDPDAERRLRNWRTKASFEEIVGGANVPENLRAAMVFRGIRAVESLTKLGSIVLSKFTDLPMTAHTMARAGFGLLSGYEAGIRGITRLQGREAVEAAELLHVGARSFAGHLSSNFYASDGALGWTNWAARLHYRIGLFEFLNEGVRRGAAEMIARRLGQAADRPWAKLNPGTRESMIRFGIDERGWEVARQGLERASDGMTYFTVDHIDRLSDEAIHDWAGQPGEKVTSEGSERARGELALRFRTMIHDMLDNTVSEPRAREHVATTAGQKPGTIPGEVMRAFTQFHGFIRTILGRHLMPATQGYGGYKPVALLAHFLAATGLAGFLSMQAKLIVKGRAPRSLIDKDGNPDLKVWGAAMAQGGGLGIYGDYLYGERARNGVGFSIAAFGGPMVSDMEEVGQIVRQSIQANTTADAETRDKINQRLPGELAGFATTHVPLINLWYTRLALDYLVFWRLREAASPGYLQRYEDRVRREEGSDFLVAPTEALR